MAARGALVVLSGFLLLAAIALLMPGHASAQTNPPAAGDWVIADQTTVASQAVTVTGNVIVENGGSLTPTSVALRIASTYPGEFALYVKNGGTLAVSSGSIQALAASNTYRFEIHGVASLNNVQPVEHMWGSLTQDKFGIQIYNGNTTITNSTIQGGDKGNILVSAGSPLIFGNTIRLARYVEESNQTFCGGAYVGFRAIGILVTNSSAPRIESNYIRENGNPSSFFDPWQAFYEQYWPQCPQTYYYIYEFLLGYGIIVRGASPEILNNQILLNSQAPSGSASRTVNGTQIYSFRYAEDWRTNEVAAGLAMTGGGKGNVTGNQIDRNAAVGVYGDGGMAVFGRNLIANHTAAPGVSVGGGITMVNSTFRGNYQAIELFGDGTGNFESIDLGSSATAIAVYVDYNAGGTANFYNTSFAGYTGGSSIQFQSYQGATVNLFNCTIDPSRIAANNGVGFINVYWSVQVQVQWPNGAPASAAFAILTNQSDGVLYADRVDDAGLSPVVWIAGVQIVVSWSGGSTLTSNSDLSIRVYANGTISDPHDFRFNSSMFLILTITDPIPPSLNVFFPVSGQGFTTSTVRVTGNAFDVGSGMERVEASADGGATWFPSTEPLPGWAVELTLPDGVHAISVRAYDASGTYTEVNVTGIAIDTVLPDIVILQPSLPGSGTLIAYTTFTGVGLLGKVDDDATLTLNGDALAVNGGSFARQLILVEGVNYFRLLAVDEVGNVDQVDFILVSDITAPALFVSSPVDRFATNRSIITVAGVTESDVALTLNDRPMRLTGGVFAEPYALSEGSNTLRITATDRAGNNNTITRTVIFDTVAPQIALTSPTANLVTRFRDLTVGGSVEPAILTVYVNGAPVPTANGAFAKVVRLDEGRNVVVVQAWDPAGNPATSSAAVTLDTVPPEVSISSPSDGALVNLASIRVAGFFANATQLVLNGVALSALSGEFDENVALAEGENRITAVVVDAAGNVAEAIVRVDRDTEAPTVTVDLPATPLRTEANVITVTGQVAGALALRVNGQLVAFDALGAFTVTVPLEMGENRITFSVEDLAGNSASVLGAVVREPVPETPQGLFGLGDLQYALLPLFLAAGVAGTYLLLRFSRKGKSP